MYGWESQEPKKLKFLWVYGTETGCCIIGHTQYSEFGKLFVCLCVKCENGSHYSILIEETSACTYIMHGHGNIFSNLVTDNVHTITSQLPGDDDSHIEVL